MYFISETFLQQKMSHSTAYILTRTALLLLVLPITMPDLALGAAVRTGAAGEEAAVPLPLTPELFVVNQSVSN